MNEEMALLARLRDVHPPPATEWWPPAPMWWILAGLLVFSVYAFRRWVIPLWRRYRLRRAFLRRLEQTLVQFGSGDDSQPLCAALSMLFRQVAMARFPEHTVAGLVGDQWFEFINQHDDEASMLGPDVWLSAYSARATHSDCEQLSDVVRRWINAL